MGAGVKPDWEQKPTGEARDRRATAERDGRWRQGGSPNTNGLTIYQGNRFVGLVLTEADARAICEAMNR